MSGLGHWQHNPMDEAYLARLERGCQPDGDMATRVYRFEERDGGGVALWQVEVRGEDLLELVRLARLALSTRVETAQTTD